jgi:hypothetical protein
VLNKVFYYCSQSGKFIAASTGSVTTGDLARKDNWYVITIVKMSSFSS